jgi:NTF2-related export protein 1/2
MDPQVIDISCKAAVKFVSTFYDTIDRKRHLIQKLYFESSILLYNGNPFSTSQQIFQFLLSLPASKHEILTIDAQPLNSDLLVQVAGRVTYGEQKDSQFSQIFCLTQQGSAYVIGSDTFRLV